jgi:predicted ribosomally synthesized peptide with nif11-like leader
MSEEQLKAFWEAIQTDPALQQKLKDVTDFDAVAEIAKEAGFTISAEKLQAARETMELSDEQLESAAGGLCCCVGPGNGRTLGRRRCRDN